MQYLYPLHELHCDSISLLMQRILPLILFLYNVAMFMNLCGRFIQFVDYGMVWMSPNHMLLPQGQGGMQPVPSEMHQIDPTSMQLENPYYPMAVPPSFESMSGQPMEMEG